MSPFSLTCAGALLVALVLAGCADGPASQPVVSAAYLERAEAELGRERDLLRNAIEHYGLVFEIAPDELDGFFRQVRVRRGGSDLVLGGVQGTELHGGGVLGLLLDFWRPGGRPASLDDRYPFVGSEPIALGSILRSHRQQVFLPVPGREREAIGDALPGTPQLPRMRFEYAVLGRPKVEEVDAFIFLRIVSGQATDPRAEWTNRLGQRLSVEALLHSAWDHYVVPRPAAQEFDDHSYLHMPEVLLGFVAAGGGSRDPNAVKRRFLGTELRRSEYGGVAASEALGHYAESLGWLLAAPGIQWRPDEKREVSGWLRGLELDRLPEVEGLPPDHLAHLVRGLRMIRDHEAKLR